jgi:two-component system invasion response regulator UvrY
MEPLTNLRKSIETLHHGVSPDDLRRTREEMLTLVDSIAQRLNVTPEQEKPHAKLSRREQQVMSMMLSGKRLKEIAANLDISVKTVTTHRSRLMKKVRVEDNLGLYRYGIRNGLISV